MKIKEENTHFETQLAEERFHNIFLALFLNIKLKFTIISLHLKNTDIILSKNSSFEYFAMLLIEKDNKGMYINSCFLIK